MVDDMVFVQLFEPGDDDVGLFPSLDFSISVSSAHTTCLPTLRGRHTTDLFSVSLTVSGFSPGTCQPNSVDGSVQGVRGQFELLAGPTVRRCELGDARQLKRRKTIGHEYRVEVDY